MNLSAKIFMINELIARSDKILLEGRE